jgi:hypothetical protein
MRFAIKSWIGLFAAVSLSVACSKPQPPPQPPPPPVKEEVKVEPPPPPKCEALTEKCAAASGTKAKIAKTDLAFEPPSGWVYAQTESATIAQTDDSGAVAVIAGYDAGDPKEKKAEANREAQFEALIKQVNVGFKKKVNWKKKPDDTKEAAGLKISLWEVDGAATRGDKKGALLIFTAPIEGTKVLLGVGFVADEDKSPAASIVKSIDTLAKGAQ